MNKAGRPAAEPVEGRGGAKGSRRQKALGSAGRGAKIDQAPAAGPDLGDEHLAGVKRLRLNS